MMTMLTLMQQAIETKEVRGGTDRWMMAYRVVAFGLGGRIEVPTKQTTVVGESSFLTHATKYLIMIHTAVCRPPPEAVRSAGGVCNIKGRVKF